MGASSPAQPVCIPPALPLFCAALLLCAICARRAYDGEGGGERSLKPDIPCCNLFSWGCTSGKRGRTTTRNPPTPVSINGVLAPPKAVTVGWPPPSRRSRLLSSCGFGVAAYYSRYSFPAFGGGVPPSSLPAAAAARRRCCRTWPGACSKASSLHAPRPPPVNQAHFSSKRQRPFWH